MVFVNVEQAVAGTQRALVQGQVALHAGAAGLGDQPPARGLGAEAQLAGQVFRRLDGVGAFGHAMQAGQACGQDDLAGGRGVGEHLAHQVARLGADEPQHGMRGAVFEQAFNLAGLGAGGGYQGKGQQSRQQGAEAVEEVVE